MEIKYVDLDESMVLCHIARQSEAERECHAKVINAKGELEVSKNLLETANILSRNPRGNPIVLSADAERYI